MDHAEDARLSADLLQQRVREAIAGAGGWLPFDRFMALALYEPGLGYYARGAPIFGTLPQGGSDFVTAPEMSPLFGAALARQVAQVLGACGADEVFEFGAGSGALAEQVLHALDAAGVGLRRYVIVDLAGALRARQQQRLERFGARVAWIDAWPAQGIEGVVLGNEVLDAMPVQLVRWDGSAWHERGVAVFDGALAWSDRPTGARPRAPGPFAPGYVTELHAQAEAFVATLAERLKRGAAFFIDYGFPEAEYYHPQRRGGTLMCHRAHRADADPLAEAGAKDITAHVDFSGIALTAQEAGLEVLGYTTQARFLVNCGLLELLEQLAEAGLRERAAAQKLLGEHEMGELFKVIALGRGLATDFMPLGFTAGDRTHTL